MFILHSLHTLHTFKGQKDKQLLDKLEMEFLDAIVRESHVIRLKYL